MSITTLSSQEFESNFTKAKSAADSGPVIITDEGKPTHVLLNITAYQSIVNKSQNIVELLSVASAANINFAPEKLEKLTDQNLDLT